MRTITVTEYGIDLIMGVSFDMSGNTDLDFRFKKPDDTLLDVTAVLGTSPIVTTAGTFAANEWAQYTFLSGDIGADDDGEWKVQLQYTDTSAFLLSSIANFDVTDNAL